MMNLRKPFRRIEQSLFALEVFNGPVFQWTQIINLCPSNRNNPAELKQAGALSLLYN